MTLLAVFVYIALASAAIRFETFRETIAMASQMVGAENKTVDKSGPVSENSTEHAKAAMDCKACSDACEPWPTAQMMCDARMAHRESLRMPCLAEHSRNHVLMLVFILLMAALFGYRIGSDSTRTVLIGSGALESKVCGCGREGELRAPVPCGHAVMCDKCIYSRNGCPKCSECVRGHTRILFTEQ